MRAFLQAGFQRLLTRLRESDTVGPVLLAVSVGLVGGIGAVLFRYLIDGSRVLFFSGGRWALPFLGDAYVILLPVLGLVIVTYIVRKWAPEAQGHGVPEVMYAVKKEGGRIRPRVAAVKAFASALCIGSGGSVGREGPIVQIGSTFGSMIGRMLGLNEDRVKLMVACGAAAGVAGTFNAPIAGVLFALEVILGNFTGRAFGLVVISSVASTALCQSILGEDTTFALVQLFSLKSPLELPLYIVLGLLAGVVALAFVRTLYFFEHVFDRWTWHPLIKSAAGGLGVGLIGYFVSLHLFGVGYEGIQEVLAPDSPVTLSVSMLLLMVISKIVATSMTLGGGGSGGVFAPSLFIGAMAGGAFGLMVNAVFPNVTAPAGAYALVGMAAVFAGTAHAPITSIVILFEMTDDYKIILPLMIAAVISYLISVKLSPDNIYTIKLRRRGGLRPGKSEFSVLDMILVTDAMSADVQAVRPDAPISKLAARFHSGRARGFPVINEKNELVGIVTEHDVENALLSRNVNQRTAADVMTRTLITCTPNQSLRHAIHLLTTRDIGRIPVVDRENPKKLLGVLRRKEIFWAYGVLDEEHRKLMERTRMDLPTRQRDSVQVEIEVKAETKDLCLRKVKDIVIPEQCLIVMLRRAERAIIPKGKTVIEPGDTLVVLTTRANEPRLREWVAGLGKAEAS